MTEPFNNRYAMTFFLHKVDEAEWEWVQDWNKQMELKKKICMKIWINYPLLCCVTADLPLTK